MTNTLNPLVPHFVQGRVIEQRASDGYINATKLCKAGGKLWGHYRETTASKDFARELSLDIGIPISKLTDEFRGRPAYLQGTWVHPQIAIHLGQWISPRFAVRVTSIVFDWMRGLPRHNAMQDFLLPSPDPWEKRFPDDFWKGIYRLKGIPWPGMTKNRPQWVGAIVNDIVWDRLRPGLREELDHRNPRLPSGHRRDKHHQNLDDDAVLVLWARLQALIAFMVASADWRAFMDNVRRAFPKPNENRPLPL